MNQRTSDNRQKGLRAVVFDFDGVAGNSLPPHLDFCNSMKQKYGLDLYIPDEQGVRKLLEIPMSAFIRRLGFPEDLVQEVIREYDARFQQDYPVYLFDGFDKMVMRLKEKGVKQAIASSNVMKNIMGSLGGAAGLFESIRTLDTSASKAENILLCLDEMDVDVSRAIYVGDTYHDYDHCQDAGIRFLGVSYGWQITPEDRQRFDVVDSISELENYIISRL